MADALNVDIERRFDGGPSIAATFTTPLTGGSITVLFGPSGAGKTTILRALAGLDQPDRGCIQVSGQTWFSSAQRVTISPQDRHVGCVFQDAALFPHLTVRRNIEYGIHTGDASIRRARVDEMLALVEISELAERRATDLSGGQARRVALARALAPSPRLLLLDEPFSALDVPAQMRLRRLLRTLVRTLEIPCVLVTHDRTEAIALGDTMVVLADGRVRQVGPVRDVFSKPADLSVARSVGVESVIPARVERIKDGLVDLRVGEVTLRAVASAVDDPITDVYACIRAEDVTIERAASAGASSRNHLPGRVIEIEPEGVVERVTLDCGFRVMALVTRSAREELGLAPGVTVVAAIKATAIHLVPRA